MPIPQIPVQQRQVLASTPIAPRQSCWTQQPVRCPDNVYGDHAPICILGDYDEDVFGPNAPQSPEDAEGQLSTTGSLNHDTQVSGIMPKILQEGGAKLINLFLNKAAIQLLWQV